MCCFDPDVPFVWPIFIVFLFDVTCPGKLYQP